MNKSLLVVILLVCRFTAHAGLPVASVADTSGFRYRIMYEIFMRSFADGNGDGVGDFPGITSKLDYLASLGVQGIWLTPFNTATSYHKYDIEDYYNVDPEYGTLDDFRTFIREAHARGIVVVMDLVANHCSSLHPWFIDASRNPNSKFKDYFVWKAPADISSEYDHWHTPKEADTTSPGFRKYYGFFWSGMPDFNFDNPLVRQEMIRIGRFWLDSVGVDGFRLDAAQHIYPDGQEASTQAWWREFRAEMEKTNPDFYMVGEVANNNKMVAPYLQKGMHAAFNFDLARDINEAALVGKDNGLVNRLIAIRSLYSSYSPEYIDATFITNHDQDRVMSNMQGDNRKAAMAASILLTLPGSPYLYYGEEIGMEGRKPDELIREPMPWSYLTVDKAQTSWEKPVYSVQGKVAAVDRQMTDGKSLLNHYKRLIRLRKSNEALLKGDLSPVACADSNVMAYVRGGGEYGKVLVLHNLSGNPAVFSGSEKALVSEVIFSNGKAVKGEKGIELPPYSTVIYSLR